jgi:general secretion pathway protein A
MSEMNEPAPFSLSPDPRLVYVTSALKTTLHKVRYVVNRRQGLTAILGDYGTGKSSTMRLVYDELSGQDDTRVVLLHTPKFKSDYAFLRGICREFGLPPRRSLFDQQVELEGFVLAQFEEARNVVLMVDEGQMLDTTQLEVVRVLLNFETNDTKLIQVVLAGQLELRDKLLEKKLGALRSRLFAPSLLSALTLQETAELIDFRCQRVQVRNRFTDAGVERIYELTSGVPREVVKVAAIAWDLAQILAEPQIGAELVDGGASEARLVGAES